MDQWEEAAKQFKPKAGTPAASTPASGADPWEEAARGTIATKPVEAADNPRLKGGFFGHGGVLGTGFNAMGGAPPAEKLVQEKADEADAKQWQENHPVINGLLHTVGAGMPAPIPMDLPGSGASLLTRGAAAVRGMFGDPAVRDAALDAIPGTGGKVLKWKNLVMGHVPSGEPQTMYAPGAGPAVRAPAPFEDFPADTRGMPMGNRLPMHPMEPLEPGRPAPLVSPRPTGAFEDFPADTRGMSRAPVPIDRAPVFEPLEPGRLAPVPIRAPRSRVPIDPEALGIHGGIENTPMPQSPVNTNAVQIAHPPFAETAPFSPSRAARQQTPAIPVKAEPLGVRGNPKALSIAERLKEEMSRQ